jgi:hypothetical protein
MEEVKYTILFDLEIHETTLEITCIGAGAFQYHHENGYCNDKKREIDEIPHACGSH